MRKITLLLFLLLVGLMPGIAQQKGLSSKELKSIEKESKKMAKEYAKDGWKISGGVTTLEAALIEHKRKLKEDKGNRTLVSYANNCRSMNVCRQAALNNAALEYATKVSSQIEGKIAGGAGLDASDPEGAAEYDRMKSGYINRVSQVIKGDLEESFTLVRKTEQGLNDLQVFFLINENTVQKKRLRAWENAVKDSNLSSEFAKSVEEFVKEEPKLE